MVLRGSQVTARAIPIPFTQTSSSTFFTMLTFSQITHNGCAARDEQHCAVELCRDEFDWPTNGKSPRRLLVTWTLVRPAITEHNPGSLSIMTQPNCQSYLIMGLVLCVCVCVCVCMHPKDRQTGKKTDR